MCNDELSPSIFFPEIEGNLTKVVWAHAVNSKALLDSALKNETVMMLEADVVLGKLKTSQKDEEIPIMAHPPATESDLSLKDFLLEVNGTKKGAKLDFKSLDAFNASMAILKDTHNVTKQPVFLNADILPGPTEEANATKPVDSTNFLSMAKAFPRFTLSLGWTTKYTNSSLSYTAEHVQQMITAVEEVEQPITYAVRAGLAANDIATMKSLMEKSAKLKNATLTIWSSEGDAVNATQLSTLIKDVGVEKVYLDLPADLLKELRLSGASSLSFASSMALGSFLVSYLFSSMARRG
ncbi:protein FAM151B isoform X2 [Nomia melanderi]|nr:protein FAM151B isoform X2 [Nomia melanderi]XP_031829315.1 protein FAM151B isoform X2 [Nomia melanderi]